jgi:hypothetical protein
MALLGVAIAAGGLAIADDRGGKKAFKADLDGFTEVPAVSSTGTGEFEARLSVNDAGETILEYELSYENLEGTTTAAAHVHIGQKSVNGGVSYFLCGGGDKPPCPPIFGTVRGEVDAADIIGPAGQGVAPGEFDEVIAAMRAGVTYANVHTNKHPGGEIRGQINGRGGDDK